MSWEEEKEEEHIGATLLHQFYRYCKLSGKADGRMTNNNRKKKKV